MRRYARPGGIAAAIIAAAAAVSVTGLLDNQTWSKVANEGATFTVPVRSIVRFGKDNAWLEKRMAAGAGTCVLAFFGGENDPAPGQTKICARKSGPEVAETPPTTPTVMNVGLAVNAASITAANAAAQPGVTDVRMRVNTAIPVSRVDLTSPAYPYATPPTGEWYEGGDLRTVCNYTHFAYDDPIVYYLPADRVPNKAHLHMFFGNKGVDYLSTSETLRTRGTPTSSCRGGTVNLSAYWTPATVRKDTRTVVVPKANLIYYKTGIWPWLGFNPPIENLPAGLRMITGDSTRSTPGQTGSSMACMIPSQGFASRQPYEADRTKFPTNCQPGDEMWWLIDFHQCWNGEVDTSVGSTGVPNNHRAHVVPSQSDHPSLAGTGRSNYCPTTHPLVIVQLSQVIWFYVTTTDNPSNWAFSSDVYLNADATKPGGWSGHADWMNGWDPVVSNLWSQKCSRERRNCGSWMDGNGLEASEFQGN